MLAIVRGVAVMVASFWALVLLQLASAFVRGGFAGVHDCIVRVVTTGVPPEHWEVAMLRMYEALGGTFLCLCLLFLAQRYLAKKLKNISQDAQRMTYSNSAPS